MSCRCNFHYAAKVIGDDIILNTTIDTHYAATAGTQKPLVDFLALPLASKPAMMPLRSRKRKSDSSAESTSMPLNVFGKVLLWNTHENIKALTYSYLKATLIERFNKMTINSNAFTYELI